MQEDFCFRQPCKNADRVGDVTDIKGAVCIRCQGTSYQQVGNPRVLSLEGNAVFKQ